MLSIEMKVHADVHLHVNNAADMSKIVSMLTDIGAALKKVEQTMSTSLAQVMTHLNKVLGDVAQLKTVDQSVAAALQGQSALIAQLRADIANGTVQDLTQADAVLANIETGVAEIQSDLVTAVTTNTDSGGTPTPQTPPTS